MFTKHAVAHRFGSITYSFLPSSNRVRQNQRDFRLASAGDSVVCNFPLQVGAAISSWPVYPVRPPTRKEAGFLG
jgi:polysaccharide deacetylase 2 family uncharacterized protein YibQ